MGWRSLFEAWMPSSAPQMVLLTFAETKVRPAAGNKLTVLIKHQCIRLPSTLSEASKCYLAMVRLRSPYTENTKKL